MLLGYARVSTADQDLALQRAALRAAGCLYRLPEVFLRSAMKLAGYRLGQVEMSLPSTLKRRVSMFSGYWR